MKALVAASLLAPLLALGQNGPFPTRKAADCTAPVEFELTLLDGWENYGAPFQRATYYKDCTGRVYLAGAIRNPTGRLTVPFELPIGYRPRAFEVFPLGHTNDRAVHAYVQASGTVAICCDGTTFVSLSGISFLAQ